MEPPIIAQLENFLSSVHKDAEKLQSFVIDEIALSELLQRAWKPIGKKLLKSLSGVIDFKNMTYNRDKGLNLELWLTDDMYDSAIAQVWDKIEKQARKIIARSYDRGIEEEGQDAFTVEKSERIIKSVSSIYAERKSNAIKLLLAMVEEKFKNYPSTTAIPAIQNTLDGLGKLDLQAQAIAEQREFYEEAAEIQMYEQLRKMRVMALQKAREDIIDELRDNLQNCKTANLAANLATARAHHFGFLDWAKENGIEYYRINAVMDAKTCKACAEMDGKVFKVSDALAYKEKFFACEGDKDKLKVETPFLTAKIAPEVKGIDLSNFSK